MNIFKADKNDNYSMKSFYVLQFVFWGAFSCYMPFRVVFLMQKNVDTITIGIILTLISAIKLICQPLWGVISDKIKSIKKIFIFNNIVATMLVAIMITVDNVTIIAILILLVAIFQAPLTPLLDSWIVQRTSKSKKSSYGKIRLWGSIGFAIIITLMGKVSDVTSVEVTFMFFCLFNIILIILSSKFCKDVEYIDNDDEKEGSRKEEVKKLLKNYEYVSFLVFSCLFFIAVAPSMGFLPKLMENAGGNESHYGIAMAVSALAEIPVLFFSSKILHRFRALPLIITGFVIFFLRITVHYSVSTPEAIILAQILQGFAYSMFLAGSVHYLYQLAPEGAKATAQTIGFAVYSGISGIVGNYIGGIMIDRNGIINAYKYGSYLMLATLFLFVMSVIVRRRNA